MCHLYVMSDGGAGTCDGGGWRGQGGDWSHDHSGARVGGVKVGADDDADRRRRPHRESQRASTLNRYS